MDGSAQVSSRAPAVRIPQSVLDCILPGEPERGAAWIAAVPGMVVELARRWHLTVGEPFEGGCTAFVAPAVGRHGSGFVLKVLYPHWEARFEAEALEAWDGDGAVRLLDREPEWSAMLLERLEPGTPLSAHPDQAEAISIGCELLRRLWRPPPPDHPFDLVTDVAALWAAGFPEWSERMGHPFGEGLVRAAAAACEAFATSREPVVIANHDYHLDNVLAASREPWLMIDPKPIAGERSFDTGHLLRSLVGDEPSGRDVHAMALRLADELDVAPEAVRSWGLIRSVQDALWTCASEAPAAARRDIRLAELLST